MRGFIGYIDSDLCQMRPKLCHHPVAIEVKATMFLLKLCLDHRSHHRDVTRRRTVVHETLVSEAGCFHSRAFYITRYGGTFSQYRLLIHEFRRVSVPIERRWAIHSICLRCSPTAGGCL